MKTKKFFRVVYKILFAVPLVVGVRSYLYAGESLSNSLYYSIQLYGFSFKELKNAVLWLEFARWIAPMMTAASIIVAVKSAFTFLRVRIMAFRKSSNIVYGDSEYADVLCDNEKDAVLCKEVPISYAKNYFIMFDSDINSLSFCQR